jgi:bacillithiol system protein YtxJ
MKWIPLTNEVQLKEIAEKSSLKPQVIFKYSTRCSISRMAQNRLERNYKPVEIDFYFLDLISFRSLSDKVAQEFNVSHESPQILLIIDGQCVYEESHSGITLDEIIEQSQGK